MEFYPLEDQMKCLKREIALRKNVYPKWIDSKHMTQVAANKEIDTLISALHSLMVCEKYEKALQVIMGYGTLPPNGIHKYDIYPYQVAETALAERIKLQEER